MWISYEHVDNFADNFCYIPNYLYNIIQISYYEYTSFSRSAETIIQTNVCIKLQIWTTHNPNTQEYCTIMVCFCMGVCLHSKIETGCQETPYLFHPHLTLKISSVIGSVNPWFYQLFSILSLSKISDFNSKIPKSLVKSIHSRTHRINSF